MALGWVKRTKVGPNGTIRFLNFIFLDGTLDSFHQKRHDHKILGRSWFHSHPRPQHLALWWQYHLR